MGIGYLTVEVNVADEALPIANADVTVTGQNGSELYDTTTGHDGHTEKLALTAPDLELTLDENYQRPAYSVCDVDVEAKGFKTVHIHGVEICDTEHTILPVHLHPLEAEPGTENEEDIDIPPVGLLLDEPYRKEGLPDISRVLSRVIIPRYIIVHLGTPQNAAARNVRVLFTEYVKNVTSSEIYSTWPNNSIIANIHCIVTFALNRIFTEWYRSRGYTFDITNSTSYDMYYRDGGVIFENISQIVDGIFNVYARRQGFVNPFFTQFCNGTTVTCPGLSQWGTVTLANQGRSPLEILRYYYPDDLTLATSNNITDVPTTYPGSPLSLGSRGENVRRIQNFLNRIRVNFPLIPLIPNPNGVFDQATQNAVRVFQQSFNMTQDGVVGRATWNKITSVYVAVARLAELDSEGIRETIGANPPNVVLSQGSRGEHVLELQFILNVIAQYYNAVPFVIQDSVFGTGVRNAVIAFQREFGLTPDGVVGPGTWNRLYSVYRGINDNVTVPPVTPPPTTNPPYPGTPLRVGSSGNNVRIMQQYLNRIRTNYPSIPVLAEDGVFGPITRSAVIAFQQIFNLSPDGIIGPLTWNRIVEAFNAGGGGSTTPGRPQYPGTPLRVGSSGNNVRIMQQYLLDLRVANPSIPAIAVDGIFGQNTRAAVIAFQRMYGLVADGIIGPLTWEAIVRRHLDL